MDMDFTLPRLFVEDDLRPGAELSLGGRVHHYLKNVMRQQPGDRVRLFNGRHGEYAAILSSVDKKVIHLVVEKQIREQPDPGRQIHLLFAPIKHARQDIMLEKSVELGVDIFHPVLTDHADIRVINPERVQLQLIEAAEQSERLTVPQMMPIKLLRHVLHDWPVDAPIIAAIERVDACPVGQAEIDDAHDIALLVGPVGGWSEAEKKALAQEKKVVPVDLGAEILRAETAAIALVAYIKFRREGNKNDRI